MNEGLNKWDPPPSLITFTSTDLKRWPQVSRLHVLGDAFNCVDKRLEEIGRVFIVIRVYFCLLSDIVENDIEFLYDGWKFKFFFLPFLNNFVIQGDISAIKFMDSLVKVGQLMLNYNYTSWSITG